MIKNRALRYSAFMVTGFILLLLIGLAFVFYTSPGRRMIVSIAEQQIENALGGNATIGGLTGNLPGTIILHNVTIDEDDNSATPHLVEIPYAELRWHPFSIIGGRIDVDRLIIRDASLHHLPPPSEKKEQEATSLSLPTELPFVRVGTLSIDHLKIGDAIPGGAATLNAQGMLDMGGKHLIADLNANLGAGNQRSTDTINLIANIDVAQQHFQIDGKLTSSAEGIVSQLAQTDGPVTLTINSASQAGNIAITMQGAAGQYGTGDAVISGAFTEDTPVSLKSSFSPGPLLADLVPYTGEMITADLIGRNVNKGGQLEIMSVTTGTGNLSGSLTWDDHANLLQNLNADLLIDIAEGRFSELQAFTGSTLKLDATLQQTAAQRYALNTNLQSEMLELSIQDGQTDLATRFSGSVSAKLANGFGDIPALEDGATLSAAINAVLNGQIKAEDIKLAIPNSLNASGKLALNQTTEAFNADVEVRSKPGLMRNFIPQLQASADSTAKITANGTIETFSLSTLLTLPELSIEGDHIPASTLDAQLTGLPDSPSGTIIGIPQQGDGTLNITLNSTETAYSIPSLTYAGIGFLLDGEGQVSRTLDKISINLTYAGDENARPFPALPLEGDLSMIGTLNNEEDSNLRLTSNSLITGTTGLAGLDIHLAGSPQNLQLTAQVEALIDNGNTLVRDTSLAANIIADEATTMNIASFSTLLFGETAIATTSPAVISLGETTIVENLNLDYGDQGTISIAGAFQPTHWQADILARNIIIPESDNNASLQLALDTAETLPAEGTFMIAPNSTENETPVSLDGFIRWDGSALKLFNTDNNLFTDFNIAIPLTLIRGDALTLTTEGPLTGTIRYDGKIEKIAAFLPEEISGLEGILAGNIDLSGTLAEPGVVGRVTLKDAAYTEEFTGLSLIDLHMEADANVTSGGSQITITGGGKGAQQTGEDAFSVNGALVLGEENRLESKILLNALDISATPIQNLITTGTVDITGPLDAIAVTGNINIDETNVEIITPPQTGLVDINVTTKNGTLTRTDYLAERTQKSPVQEDTSAGNIRYDLAINADDRIFIRGRGLDSEWETALTVTTSNDEPVMLGSIDLRRGSFDFSGRRFDLTQGNIVFDRLSPNDPIITMTAAYETGEGILAEVNVTGRASDTTVSLTSTPERPPSDVMALVLFGKPSEDLSAVESLQTAQALASLGGIGPFGGGNVLNSVRQSVGLDLLNVDFDPEQGASSLTVGKYIAEGLFVSATQDARGQNGSVRIEYELTDNITAESDLRQNGDQTISVNWKKDF